MGLYLCVFDEDREVDGVEVGSYADFNILREYLVTNLEAGVAGSMFPTFILHPDSDGEWDVSDCAKLRVELVQISESLKTKPALPFVDWQKDIARSIGLRPRNAFESIIVVDGEFLLDRLQSLVQTALDRKLPIIFQ
jgi:hypothetical protein